MCPDSLKRLNCEGRGETSPGPAAPAGGSGAPWGSLRGHFWTWCSRTPSQDSHWPLFFLFLSSSRAHLPLGPRALRFSHAPPQPAPGCTAPLALLPSRVEPGPGWDCSQQPQRSQTLQDVGRGTSEVDRGWWRRRGAWVPPPLSLLLIRKMGLNQALKQESRPAGRSACSSPPRLDPLGQMEAPPHPRGTLQRIKLSYG